MTDKATRKIHKFDFEGKGSHVALVGPAVGGPANSVTTLITKATADLSKEEIMKAEVRVDISFREFLMRFMNMYYSDAIALAKLLGYEVDEWDDEWAESKVEGITLLKSASQAKDFSAWLEGLNETDLLKMLSAKDTVEKALSNSGKPEDIEVGDIKMSSESLPNEEDTMKPEELAELETLRKQAAEQAEALAELKKAKEQLDAIQKAAEEKATAEMTTLVKSFSFVEEESVSALVTAIQKSGDTTILDVLTKAAEALEAAVTSEVGDQGAPVVTPDNVQKSRVSGLIQKRLGKTK